jgi:hypothetical protein
MAVIMDFCVDLKNVDIKNPNEQRVVDRVKYMTNSKRKFPYSRTKK